LKFLLFSGIILIDDYCRFNDSPTATGHRTDLNSFKKHYKFKVSPTGAVVAAGKGLNRYTEKPINSTHPTLHKRTQNSSI